MGSETSGDMAKGRSTRCEANTENGKNCSISFTWPTLTYKLGLDLLLMPE